MADELPPLTARVRRSLQHALEIARENGQEVVGTEHVVLAFLDDPSGIAGMTLHTLGMSEALRDEIVRIITSVGYNTSSRAATRSTPSEPGER